MLPIGKVPFGEDVLQSYLDKIQPDIFVSLCDLCVLRYFIKSDRDRKPGINLGKTKWMPYIAIDGEPLVYWTHDDGTNGCYHLLNMATRLLSFSKYGQNVLKSEGFESDMIYHGVDLNKFHVVKNRDKLKKEMFGDKFVFGCVARNQPRKQLQYLLEAWKTFSKDKKDVILYLHTDPGDPQAGGVNLIEVIHRFGIKDTVAFTKHSNSGFSPYSFSYGVSTKELNDIYNCFDVHAVQTTGEGFGIPYIESMAAGIPNISIDYTTPKELFGDHGWLVKPIVNIVGSYYVERALPDIKDWIAKLEDAYENKDKREEYSKKGLEFVKQFDWEVIMPSWDKAFNDCLNKLKARKI